MLCKECEEIREFQPYGKCDDCYDKLNRYDEDAAEDDL